LRFAYWWRNDNQDGDPYVAEVSNDNGTSWTTLDTIVNQPAGWQIAEYYIADYVALTSAMKFRFSVADTPDNSIDEGALDAVLIFDLVCP